MSTGISEETRRQPINKASNGDESRQTRTKCHFCGEPQDDIGWRAWEIGDGPLVYCADCERLAQAIKAWIKRAPQTPSITRLLKFMGRYPEIGGK